MSHTIIESLTDRDAYVRLGALNTTPGAPDDETLEWALSATRARVADTATEDDRARLLAWVREGEATREPAPEFHLHHAGRPLHGDSNAYHMGDRDPASFADLQEAIRVAQSLDETCGWDIDVVRVEPRAPGSTGSRSIAWGYGPPNPKLAGSRK